MHGCDEIGYRILVGESEERKQIGRPSCSYPRLLSRFVTAVCLSVCHCSPSDRTPGAQPGSGIDLRPFCPGFYLSTPDSEMNVRGEECSAGRTIQ
jgi:hypothetical protein